MAEEDLIFGKNRHLFGGMEPSNMVSFKVTRDTSSGTARMKVEAVPPADTKIENQTLCVVAGAEIRRKETNYPVDEFDGVAVTTVKGSTMFYDDAADPNGTYYYSAFPFTTQGVYNRNKANRVVVNEPANMVEFRASAGLVGGKDVVQITATLPAGVAGVIIRRSTSSYPNNENEGEAFKTITSNGVYTDTNVAPGVVYYYSAFPYTSTGAYNRNPVNRTFCEIAAGEPPGNMVVFTAKSKYVSATNSAEVEITATLPSDAAGMVIRRSTTSFPVNEISGEPFKSGVGSGIYIDRNVTVGTTYYYSAFPYSDRGVYNRNEANRTSVEVSKYKYLYGFDLVNADSNPATRVSYPADVDNAGFTPAKMNFGSGKFENGSWGMTPGSTFMPRPCMLKFDGTVAYYLNLNDYTKKEDGTASDIANSGFGANAMMEWPKIYTKRWEENGVYKFRCSDAKIDNDWECWCNYDRLNNEINHFYTPIYGGSLTDGKLRSLSGKMPMTSQTRTAEIGYAVANGQDWYIEVVSDRLLIQDLLVLISRSTAGDATFGNGVEISSSGLNPLAAGRGNQRGLFWGSNASREVVKVFGMDDFWGNGARAMAGLITIYDRYRLKVTRGTKDGTGVNDYNTNGAGYLTGFAGLSGNQGNYISAMQCTPFGRLPLRTAGNPPNAIGSATTYETDGASWSLSDSRPMYGQTGGYNPYYNGPFGVHNDLSADTTNPYRGASVSCKPCKGIGNNA